jgi:hypothetical protein
MIILDLPFVVAGFKPDTGRCGHDIRRMHRGPRDRE